jgi:hypothetical protein
MNNMNCACGKPLHYTDPETERLVTDMSAKLGETMLVSVGPFAYRVQRHYIALHGLMGSELERLAKLGIVERIDGEPPYATIGGEDE